jgi:hypothetical protein
MSAEKRGRNLAILLRRREGATLQRIGDEFGISQGCVRQVIKNHERAQEALNFGSDGAGGELHEWTPQMQAHEFRNVRIWEG